MTRGLAEITRLGVALGGRAETFMGLAGVGDLILTCTGDLSRNRRVGLMLAPRASRSAASSPNWDTSPKASTRARSRQRIAATARHRHADHRAVCRVLDAPQSAAQVARELLSRDAKAESL